MNQSTLEDYFDNDQSLDHRYSVSIHVSDNTGVGAITTYIADRFPQWYIAIPETPDSGNLHIQAYAETSNEFDKKDRNKFQRKGAYHKYLNPDIKKPFACATSRRSRYYNVMYVLKAVSYDRLEWWLTTPELCTEKKKDIRFSMWEESQSYQGEIASSRRKADASQSYESKLERWYLDIPVKERPQDVGPLADRMHRDNMIPWQYCAPSFILKACVFLLTQHGDAKTRDYHIRRSVSSVEKMYENNMYG